MGVALDQKTSVLTRDENGSCRIAGSRVLLELVIQAHRAGATPEYIVECYDTAPLPEVIAAIAYCEAHPDETDEYLAHRERQAREIRQKIEARQGKSGDLWAEVLRRRKA